METVGPHGLRTVVDNGHWPEHSRNRTTLRMRPAAPAAPSLVDLSQDGHDRSNGGARSASQRGPLVGGQGLCQAEPDSTPRRVGPGRPLVVFRARRRGTAVEATICDVLAPSGASPKRAWKGLKGGGVDYLLKGSGSSAKLHLSDARQGFLPASALGPILTWRPVANSMVPAMDELSLSLGDIELF